MSVSDFMTRNLIVAQPEMKIFDAVDLMKKIIFIVCLLLRENK